MANSHLLATADPYKTAGSIRALCGKLIERPEIQHEFDEVPTGARLDLSSLHVCRKCIWCCMKSPIAGRYLYAIRNEQLPRKDGDQ